MWTSTQILPRKTEWRVNEWLLFDAKSALARTSTFFSMRWWCPLCTSQTPLVGFFSASSLKQQVVGRHVTPFRHIILIETTRLCSSVYKYNLEIMSHLWHWSQNSHNCFQSYLSAFSRSISSFLNLWIFQNKSSIVYWYDHVNIIHVRSC
jgi:hypothetical protein